ncbi:MAG TPA: PilZ domain-containing protein [Micropepsaceae bacterium]|jgi:hypothetical protein|nr:PilZ domain-containing protein [Micropepsaceae bacterium]
MAQPDSADLPPRVVNQRQTSRKRTLLGGKVVYGDGQHVRDCTIRDLSETGARIAIAKGEVIPTRVFLIDRRVPIAYEATVSWIKAPDFGLAFLRVHSLKGDLPPELDYLKRVWSKHCVPLGGTPV